METGIRAWLIWKVRLRFVLWCYCLVHLRVLSLNSLGAGSHALPMILLSFLCFGCGSCRSSNSSCRIGSRTTTSSSCRSSSCSSGSSSSCGSQFATLLKTANHATCHCVVQITIVNSSLSFIHYFTWWSGILLPVCSQLLSPWQITVLKGLKAGSSSATPKRTRTIQLVRMLQCCSFRIGHFSACAACRLYIREERGNRREGQERHDQHDVTGCYQDGKPTC